MTNKEFIEKLKRIATDYKTLYVMGCFGAPLTGGNVTRYCNNHSYNKQTARTNMIKAAANQNPPVYGFDCVCLIKGVLWGWCGNASATYGGAAYTSNGVPDIGADTMITKCSGLSTDFSNIEVGEAVWLSGHIGVYIGDGLAVECSPAFANKVQITAVGNIGKKNGYNTRTWTKHGKLPYITYIKEVPPAPEVPEQPSGGSVSLASLNVGDIVNFTGGSHYSNANAASGSAVKASKAKVTDKYPSGKHPVHLRAVNDSGSFVSGVYGWVDLSSITGKSSAESAPTKSIDEIAREVIRGNWGNGATRKQKLTAEGYDYSAVQKRVNELLK